MFTLRNLHPLELQHGFGKQPHFVVRHFRRQNLSEPALHFVHARHFDFAEVKEFSIATADDEQELLFLSVAQFAHENHKLAPVKRLGRRFGHVECFARLGELHPGFQRHHARGRGIGDGRNGGH